MIEDNAQTLPHSTKQVPAQELNQVYIGRQPILDRNKRIFGYELLFRSGAVAAATFRNNIQATASVMVNALNNIGITKLIGDKKGFINVDAGVLNSGIIDLLPKKNTILEILESVEINGNIIDICGKIRQDGYHLALDDFVYKESFEKMFRLVNYIKVDMFLNDRKALPGLISNLKRHQVKLLAEKVETQEDFEFCLAHGFDLFQGYFFAKPSIITGRSISPANVVLLKLAKMLAKEEEIYIIEQFFKKNPELQIKLLQFMNSAAFYMPQKVTSIRQSIALLGYRNLQKWVTLLLYAGEGEEIKSSPLFERAAIRGRIMELMAKEITNDVATSDTAFITGVLSLIGVLFQVSMEDLLKELNLSKEINDALIHRSGFLGSLVTVMELLELEKYQEITAILEDYNMEIDKLFTIEHNTIIEFENINN